MPSGRSSKVRPSEVAADTKKNFIPMVSAHYAKQFPPYSILYAHPTRDLEIPRLTLSTKPPVFSIVAGDPVTQALNCGALDSQESQGQGGPRVRVPFICAANDRRPGGDWETGCSGYEEKLCRRSNLSATLSSPLPDTGVVTNYPIPSMGGILSDSVVVCRGPHERYERLDTWYDLPVVSVPPTRWPKLKDNGTKYSFAQERDMAREKIRGALRICLYNGYNRVVVGDFGLGNGHRNPPQELAEMWRDVLLFDPDLRGQFRYVVFVFDDPHQSTSGLILHELARQDELARKKSSSGSGSKRRRHRGESSSSSGSAGTPTDLAIFEHVFQEGEIARVLSERDPRYGLDMITT
ncbi:uncharacterized protein F5Z01DRAFT_683442 [Emericellopsis atlantica]|uniref:Microbial-type PARG catalytic domain-containing protein n=1 Tax=Emericellopsis atlantica TaxID=2614577 RepID=A0A9P8CLK4_9HYPO|nr:uncharacterized protein F5Z01DRAFT_683442 [Emericellopsis atlantica]KAG9251157.1 hypothetical protein F5Z01DRAFT_683442 [Emericellopsis atlantica]